MKIKISMGIIAFSLLVQDLHADIRQKILQTFRYKNAEQVFTDIYNCNFWMGWESRSGQGSNKSTTSTIREALPQLFHELDIQSVVDAPCGDFNWMQYVIDELQLGHYIGVDIVRSMIDDNNARYRTANRSFVHANLIEYIPPKVDLIFSRDCLAHLSYADAVKVLENFKASGSTYLLTSHHLNTATNRNIVTGDHYPINLCCAPFNLPKPIHIIVEKDTESASRAQGKTLALWRLADIDTDAMKQ